MWDQGESGRMGVEARGDLCESFLEGVLDKRQDDRRRTRNCDLTYPVRADGWALQEGRVHDHEGTKGRLWV